MGVDRSTSAGSYPAVVPDGSALIVKGTGVWIFLQGLIAVMDAYRKSFPDPPTIL